MNMDEFVKSLESQAKVGDRQLTIRPSPRSGQVFITLINLPKGVGGAGGGAEAMNNRFLATVEGFGDQSKANFGKGSGDEPPTGKVKATTSVALWDKDGKTHKMRGKSGKPEAIAKYVAGFVSALAKLEPNYTHTKMAHMTPQTIANELRHVLAYLNGSEGNPSRKELAGWLGRIAAHMGGKATTGKKAASSKDVHTEVRHMIAYLEGSEGQPEIEVMADWLSRTAAAVYSE